MTDSKLAKVAPWGLALFPAWGRIDVDQHYLSQVTLGVWLAALLWKPWMSPTVRPT